MESSDTPLHKAARQGDTEAIVALIDAGADPNAKDDSGGDTPLHQAAKGGHAKAIAALLAAGADPNAKDIVGFTPVHQAAEGKPRQGHRRIRQEEGRRQEEAPSR